MLRVGSLGDHLIALPIYRRLRECHSSDTLILISSELARGDGKLVRPAAILPPLLFDEMHGYPVGRTLSAVRETYRLFRRLGLDVLYYAMPVRSNAQRWRDRVFFQLAGIRVVGIGPDSARRPLNDPGRPGSCEHETERLARAVCRIEDGFQVSREELSLELNGEERNAAKTAVGQRARCAVTLSIGTKCDVNDWGLENWRALVTALAQVDLIETLVFVGAAEDHAASDALCARWPRTAVNLCGAISPRVSAAVIAQSSLFIGHDSGPMHMAAAVGTPIVAVFSSRNLPGAWFPLSEKKHVHYTQIDCMGCGRVRCLDRRKECIRRISVEEVYASCATALRWKAMANEADRPVSGL